MDPTLNNYKPSEGSKNWGAQEGYQKNESWNIPGHVVTGAVYGLRHLDMAISGIFEKNINQESSITGMERAAHFVIGAVELIPVIGSVVAAIERLNCEKVDPRLESFLKEASRALGSGALAEDDPVRKLLLETVDDQKKYDIETAATSALSRLRSFFQEGSADRKTMRAVWKEISPKIVEHFKGEKYEIFTYDNAASMVRNELFNVSSNQRIEDLQEGSKKYLVGGVPDDDPVLAVLQDKMPIDKDKKVSTRRKSNLHEAASWSLIWIGKTVPKENRAAVWNAVSKKLAEGMGDKRYKLEEIKALVQESLNS